MSSADLVEPLNVVVLVGTRWRDLEHHGTRWRAVLQRWADEPRVGRLTVVDYPSFERRRALGPGNRLATRSPSWHPRISLVSACIPAPERATPWDHVAWRRAAGRLRRVVRVAEAPLLAVAATPLWAPVLPLLRADRTAFDAVDDWREFSAVSALHGRVEAGYRSLSRVDRVTCNTSEMSVRLRRDYGVDAHVVPNGVDLQAYSSPPPTPLNLPDRPFAVYVGVVQDRVDVDLLVSAARALPELPVVIAGPVDEPIRHRLEHEPVVLLGRVPVDEVPGLLRAAAVGLLPHRITGLTASMGPMKLLEYLAAGLPVVSTGVAGADGLSDRVFVTPAEPEPFVEAMRKASRMGRLASWDPAVANRSWDRTAQVLLDRMTTG